MSTIEKIKMSVTCVQVANMFGRNLPAHGGRTKSYRNGSSNKSSLDIKQDSFSDYGEQTDLPYGDCIELYERFKNCSKAQAIEDLAEYAGIENDGPRMSVAFKRQQDLLDSAVAFFWERLRSKENTNAQAYIKDLRKISPYTAERLKIGYFDKDPTNYLINQGFEKEEIESSGILNMRGRIIIPYTRNGKVVYLNGRSMDPNSPNKYMKLKRNEYNEHSLWGIDTIKRDKEIYMPEGILDAVTLEQEGYQVASAAGGQFTKSQFKELMGIAKHIKDVRLIICPDHDPLTMSGHKFAIKTGIKILEQGILPEIILWDKESPEKKDINDEYVNHDPSLNILKNRSDFETYWIMTEANNLDDSDIKKILRMAKKRGESAIIRARNKILEWVDIEPEVLKEIIKSVKAPPSDAEISDEILKEGDLLHQRGLGWFKYVGQIWRKVKDVTIEGEINSMFGKQRRKTLVDSAIKTTERDANSLRNGKEFNEDSDWVSFKNCKVCVKTGETRPNHPSDMNTIMLDYEYDKTADCPEIHNTVKTIFNEDQDLIKLFYEIAGSCLSRKTNLEKAFIMYGKGSNGKSIVIELLKKMVGKENYSNIELEKLGEEKNVASLYGKMANFASEISGQMKGIEDQFKKIVSGEEIQGKYLYQDPFSFRPFTTLVFASNKFLRTNETSDGVKRRIMFMDYSMSFVDNPDPNNPLQRKKDVNLLQKLEKEIPGLFNRAIKALREVEERGYYTEPECHRKHMKEFEESSNPIMKFYKEKKFNFELDPFRKRTEIYKDYVQWCEETGQRASSGQVFWHKTAEQYIIEEIIDERGVIIHYKGEK